MVTPLLSLITAPILSGKESTSVLREFLTVLAHSSTDCVHNSARVCGAYFGVSPAVLNNPTFSVGLRSSDFTDQWVCPTVASCSLNKPHTDLARYTALHPNHESFCVVLWFDVKHKRRQLQSPPQLRYWFDAKLHLSCLLTLYNKVLLWVICLFFFVKGYLYRAINLSDVFLKSLSLLS